MKLIAITLLMIVSLQIFPCEKKEVEKKFDDISQLYGQYNEEIKNILGGNYKSQIAVSSLFGFDLKKEKVQEFIDTQTNNIANEEFIPKEIESTFNCLVQLKQTNKAEKLKELSILLLKNKIILLQKNIELNDHIKKSLQNESEVPDVTKIISDDKKKAEILKKELVEKVLVAESEMVKTQSRVIKELSAFRAKIENIKLEIVNLNLKFTSDLESQLAKYKQTSEALTKINYDIQSQNKIDIENNFFKVNAIWKDVVKNGFKIFIKDGASYGFPIIPPLPRISSQSSDEKLELSKAQTAIDEVIELKKEILNNITLKKNRELLMHHQALILVNNVRSGLYQKLSSKFFFQNIFDARFWNTLKLEIFASPYKILSFFYSKFLYFKQQISLGASGFKQISYDVILILLIIGSAFLINIFLNRLKKKIDLFKNYLLKKIPQNIFVKFFSTWWSKLKDEFKSSVWYFILYHLKGTIHFEGSDFIISLIQVYLGYRILKLFIFVFLSSFVNVEFKNFHKFKQKAHLSANSIGKLYLFYFLSMLFLEETLGRVYIYTIISKIAIFITLYLLVKISKDWHDELGTFIKKKVSGDISSKINKTVSFFPLILRPTFLLLFVVLILLFNSFVSLTQDFEISKKISANLFRRQVESFEEEDNDDFEKYIPESYLDFFSYKSLNSDESFISQDQELEEGFINEVQDWIDEKTEEHSMVLYGDKGVGKTTLLKHIQRHFEKDNHVNVFYSKVDGKLNKKEDFHKYFSNLFGTELNDGNKFDIINFDKAQEKKILIILDEAQNLFLSESGGFQAYYELINFVNLNTENIFWVLSLNKFSWLFLDRAFGRQQFFRNVFHLKGWSDAKIKELIYKRHNQSKFKLSFDMLIAATKSEEEIDRYSSIEAKFFKLLWELSSGNPRAALILWLTALKRKNNHSFNVNVPRLTEYSILSELSDDTLFVLASILTHENLTSKEITHVTNLPMGIVRNAIKVGLENDLLFRHKSGRYMIDVMAQNNIIKFLKSKNFIYGT